MEATKNGMSMRKARAMATEFVTPGHPDKVCDQMADAIVDAAIQGDPKSRVAMEVTGGHGLVVVIGEMTTSSQFDIGEVVRETYRAIGHDHPIGVLVNVVRQAPDISQGVTEGQGLYLEQGAGDQGIMVGYAINDGYDDYMPESWHIARALTQRLVEVRQNGTLPYLSPDGKSQVTVIDGKVTHVTLAAHHAKTVELEQIREDLIAHVIRHVMPDADRLPHGSVVVNGTGRFVQGGFDADAGTTGRKLMVDNYGPNIEVGGGCYSGKDPSKVDRSAAYFCRFVAKSIVAGGHAREALVKVGYAIGVAEPTHCSILTDLPVEQNAKLEAKVVAQFNFTPKAMIEQLGLLTPTGWRYRDTAAAGHYGDPRFPWEQPTEI